MLRLSLALTVALLIVAGDVAAQIQFPRPGMPPRDNAAPPTGTARIRGRVTAAETRAPLRRAQVTLTAAELGVRRITTTDPDGRYEFAELPAGRYVIAASKGGFVTLQAGQRRPFEPGTPMAVADGQALGNVDVALPRGSVIAGRITDEFGEPIAGAQVMTQRYQYGPGGRRQLTFAQAPFVQTDDLGQFRVYGLMPGEYVLSATVRNGPIAMGGASVSDTSEGFAPTFYPGTANPAEAQPVAVGLGQELSLHIALTASRMARVSGTVTDSQGKPATGAMVMLRSRSGGGMMSMMGGQVGADGAFTVANVPPGEHFLDVRPQPRRPDVPTEFASVPVSVTGDDINGLRVVTGAAARVRGRVIFEGTAARTGGFGPLRVFAQSADPQEMGPMFAMIGGPAMDNGTVAEDGTFELAGVMGTLLFRVGAPPAWALKSVTIAGEDVTDVPYAFKGSQTLSDVRIVLTDKLTELSGRVTDDRGRGVTDYVVVVLPAETREGASAMRFTRTVRPDQEGAFRLRGLPPGRYVVAAVESVEQGGEWNPELQSRIRDAARSFSLTEGQSLALDLKLRGGI